MTFSWAEFSAGWAGGAAGLIVGHPADTIKVQQQLFRVKSGNIIYRKIMCKEGFLGLFKGMLIPLVTAGTQNSVYFGVFANTLSELQAREGTYHDIKTCADSDVNENWHRNVFIAGSMGGFAQFFVMCPVENIKIKRQAQSLKTRKIPTAQENRVILRRIVSEMWKHTGWRGFFRGGVPMLVRDVPAFGVYILCYEHMLSMCRTATGSSHYSIFCQMMAGGMAGAISWGCILPIDVVKSRIQADRVERPSYKGMIDCFVKSYRGDGLSIFFRGFWLMMLRAFPSNAVTFVVYEILLKASKSMKTNETNGSTPEP